MRVLFALVCLAAASGAAHAQGKPTPIYQDDFATGKRTKIDAPTDELDAQLDSALGGPQGFSTRDLEQIENRLRSELRAERPRATPKLVVFLYPGRVSAERLKSMAEIDVDIELVIDPCDRTVCRDAVARHIELVGRAVGKTVYASPGYKLVFKTLTLEAAGGARGDELSAQRIAIADCITAAAKPGGGLAWLDARAHAVQDFEPLMLKSVAHEAALRRVQLIGVPSVSRTGGSVDVSVHAKGDRNRMQQQVLDALVAEMTALRSSSATPSDVRLEVALDVPMRKVETHRYRAPGAGVAQELDGKIDLGGLWATYVEEVRQDVQHIGFDDREARGGGDTSDAASSPGPPDDNEALQLLNARFGDIGACAKAEAARNRAFHGVLVQLHWQPSGQATDISLAESALRGGALHQCLAGVIGAIRLPRFTGEPREIDYPIRLK
ncbi:MAG TPA: hypothetical protein VIA18_17200 [Polyangia bacterium]|nr:hypothetical protein [Polyangia bacterium]